MGTTSADPNELANFVTNAGAGRKSLDTSLTALISKQAAVVAACIDYYVTPRATAGAQTEFASMATNETFVSGVHDALVAADKNASGVVSVSDTDVAAQLRGTGAGTPPPVVTVDPAVLMGQPPTSGFVDDPICAANGNFVQIDHDLFFPGRTAVLDVLRTYNSLGAGTIGAFGPGWSSVLDLRISAVPGGVLRVHLADGAVVPFADRGDGVLIGAGARDLTVTVLDDGWVLHEGHTKSWHFDEDGRFTGGVGGAATLVVRRDDLDRVVEMSETRSGRSVSFGWADNRVVSAATSDGRTASYRYDDRGVLVAAERRQGTIAYGVLGRLITSVTDADGVRLALNVYDDDGRVVEQTNEMGRTTRYQYSELGTTLVSDTVDGPRNAFTHDQRGNLTALVDGLGRSMRLTYDDHQRVTRVVGRDGAVREHSFDSHGNLIGRVDPDGLSAQWEWDEQGRLVVETHRNGSQTTYHYVDGDRRPSWIVGPDGSTITVHVGDADLPIEIVDADGVTTKLEWDADGQLTARIDALGNRTEFRYDPAGLPIELIDGAGRATTLVNDAAGRLVEAVIGEGSTTFDYTDAGRPLSAVDPAGVSWSARYGDNGRLDVFTDGEGSEVRFEWDLFGNIDTVVAPDGGRYGQVFDAVGNLIAATDPEGNASTLEVDAEGRVITATDAVGRQWRRELDVLGRTVVSIAPDGARTRYEYHFDGSVARVVHPDGTSVSTEVDVAGRVRAVIDERRARYEVDYTPAGRPSERRWPSGRVQRWTYDAAGRLATVEDDDGTVELTLDGRGTVVSAVGPGGRVDYDLDESGDLLGAVGPFGSQEFGLDAAGRVTEVIDGEGGRTSYTRDSRGLVTSATDGNGLTTAMSFDVRGRLAQSVAPNGDATTFDYDPVGWLRSVTDPSGNASTSILEPTGRSLGYVGADGTRVDYTLDAVGRTVAVGVGDAVDTSFAYDDAGRLTEALKVAEGLRTTFQWDPSGLLERVSGPSGDLSVERDADGLSTSWTQNGIRIDVTRDRTGRIVGLEDPLDGTVVRPGPVETLTDLAGRITADGRGDLYRYDTGGRLTEAIDRDGVRRSFRYGTDGLLSSEFAPDGETTYHRGFLGRIDAIDHADGTRTDHVYDPAGRRTRSLHSSGNVTDYRWDDLGRLIAVERTAADGTARRLDIDLDAFGRPVGVGGLPVLWDDVRTNRPLQIGGTRYLHLDGRSRPVGGDGAWSEPTDDPWGNESDDSARVGMRGELAAAGLVWMGARVYDPSSREFLSPDPLPPVPGRPGYAGLYSYGFLNPVNHLDPSGLRPVSQADYDKIRTAEEQGRFGQAWQAIKDDPWGTLAMVAVTAVGVALVATGVGTAIGAGILIGVAASAAMGVATGTFSPRGVAISGAIGAIPGGSTLRGAMLVGAAGGFAGSVATDVAEGRPVNLEAAGISTVLGAGGGAAAHGIATHLGGARPTIEEPTTPTARFVVDGNGVTTDLQAPIAVSAGKPQLALPPGTGTNPWADGPVITSRVVGPGGENVNMAMGPGQPVPGGWSTPDHIPSVDFVRQDLAVTPSFKPQVSDVQTYHVPEGVRVQDGIVGPQTEGGVTYPGGAHQIQILNYGDRSKLTPVGPRQPIS